MVALGLVAAAALVPTAVLARRGWDVVIGSAAPATVEQALVAGQVVGGVSLPGMHIDPGAVRVVASAETSRGPVYLLAGPSSPRTIPTSQGPIAGQCTTLLFAFPIDAPSRRVTVEGRHYWVDGSGGCGGVPPPRVHAPLDAGGSELADEHLAFAFGRLGPDAKRVLVTDAAHHRRSVPTLDGFFVVVTADDGLPRAERVVELQIVDAQGRVVAKPFGQVARPLPTDSSHPIVGTAVELVHLAKGHRRTLAVTFANSGAVSLDGPVDLRITAGGELIRRRMRVRLYPDAERTVLVRLPASLHGRTPIHVATVPLPGERNLQNNRATITVILGP